MTFKNPYSRIVIRTVLLFIGMCATAYLLVSQFYFGLAIMGPVLIYQLVDFFKFQKKTQNELASFLEAVHYRDFSRYFDEKHAPADIQPLRKGFNEINSTFKIISKEKETQYQYVQKILEMVDTGILSYDLESGEVVWMNETIKKLTELPYLKTIQSLERRDKLLFEAIRELKPGKTQIVTVHLERSSFKDAR